MQHAHEWKTPEVRAPISGSAYCWANELHPTKDGFRAVAAKIAREI
jgi:hypothetical protein